MMDLQSEELDNILVSDSLKYSNLITDCLQSSRVLLLHRHLLHCHHLSRIQVATLVHLAKPSFSWVTMGCGGDSLTHSLTRSLTRSLAHSLAHSLARSLARPLARPPTRPPAHSPTRSLTHSLTYPAFFLSAI